MAKSKTKALKQQELLADVQNETKTFEQIAKEIEGEVTRETKEAIAKLKEESAEKGVPRLCNALRREHRDMKPKEIRLRVIARMCPHVWSSNYVRTWWPDWMKSPGAIDAGIAGDQGREQKSYKNSFSQDELDKEEEQEPVESYTMDEWEETHPTIEKSPFQLIGDINKAIARLWTTLTNNPNMPHMEDNVKRDLIIPTRPFFKDIVNGSSKTERDFLFNWLTWLNMCIADRINIVEKADKTAYDREN